MSDAMDQAPESRFVEAGGRRLHYQEMGSGAPVILLHGGGPGASGWSNYRRNAAALAARHRVIIMDMPGYGQSTKGIDLRDPFLDLSRGVTDLTDALELQRPHLVGNSLGGGAALRAALEAPHRFGRLVLMGPAGGQALFTPMPSLGSQQIMHYYTGEGPTREKLKSFIGQLLYDQSVVTDELLDERFAASTQPDLVATPPIYPPSEPPKGLDIWRDPRLTTLANPTLIVWGTEDRVNPMDGGFALLKQIPDAEMHLFTRCGHWAQWEKADAFNSLVLDFFARGAAQ